MILNLIIAFVSISFIRKQFDLKNNLPFWDDVLNKARFVSIGVVAFSMFFNDILEHFLGFVWFVIFATIIYVLWLLKDNRLAKMLTYSVLPFFVIGTFIDFFKLFFLAFYNDNDTFLDLLYNGSILWLLAFGIGAFNQFKSTKKEKAKSQKIQEENVELEVLVKERTAKISEQKEVLENALLELKSTQEQLIQSEKLASLGELTAGIAHEIQNPLNFVNNFSEVSGELIDEMREELLNGDKEEAMAIADDIKQNLTKITHHGNRASGIVNGMLEHSRTSSGERELIDINALADEYLRLSYHGLRAKDKSFNANFKADFDENLPKIKVVSQDIGRVLLNLINNAFQATSEEALKRKLNSDGKEAKSDNYKPTLTVSTKFISDDASLTPESHLDSKEQIQISIKDNGSGVPDSIKDKIFQPFFTTKPTGKGTGLGLSLAYDIIKAHGGELTVESEIGEGSEFLITLPL